MIQKPSPGNWEYVPSTIDPKKHAFAILDVDTKSSIADVYKKNDFIDWGHKDNGYNPLTTEANAKLLAAAPQMLKALRAFVLRTSPEVKDGKVTGYIPFNLDTCIIMALEAIKAAHFEVVECESCQDHKCQKCINNIEVIEAAAP